MLDAIGKFGRRVWELQFSIGVHLGDVIEKDDGTVYGDGVNIAARLEGISERGGITVSDSVHVTVRDRIVATFEDIGEHVVKNIPRPVRAFLINVNSGASAHAAAKRAQQHSAAPLGNLPAQITPSIPLCTERDYNLPRTGRADR